MKNTIKTFAILFLLLSYGCKAQQIKKDSLFFEYDSNYIRNFVEASKDYYLKDSSGGKRALKNTPYFDWDWFL